MPCGVCRCISVDFGVFRCISVFTLTPDNVSPTSPVLGDPLHSLPAEPEAELVCAMSASNSHRQA